ncbi:TlpA family protein disulfide reductase [Saccharopolyspora rhizosphaerae]|uniref:TlpA family protein disulfide reductase n=1 Tax=Saccharopolyspora rhizosphaerae TaxID=2492662 RepID=A0A3R8P2L5_9PSEU|nr:TlpA disulfide reductase family protein [Saccharopolyspora rhizosphaerae]RRO15059.1 TlpA family protein disulfide reductase [Saccharopolyspora rhizosphaerae]
MNLRAFRSEIQWTVVVVVLAVLAAIALWPRDQEQLQPVPSAAPPPTEEVDPQLRAAAALQACASGPGGPAELSGTTVRCLADGRPTDLAGAASGGPVLVNLWATWCVPCRTELPALQAYSAEPGAARVLGVQVDSGPAEGLDLLRALGVHFPNVHDGDNRARAALRAPAVLPVSYVVTAAGEVRRIDPPVAFESPSEVRAAVERTLGDQ